MNKHGPPSSAFNFILNANDSGHDDGGNNGSGIGRRRIGRGTDQPSA